MGLKMKVEKVAYTPPTMPLAPVPNVPPVQKAVRPKADVPVRLPVSVPGLGAKVDITA